MQPPSAHDLLDPLHPRTDTYIPVAETDAADQSQAHSADAGPGGSAYFAGHHSDDHQQDEPYADEPLMAVDRWVRESPAWLLSAVLHLVVLLVLGLCWIGATTENPLALHAEYAENLGEQLIEDELVLDALAETEVDQQAVEFEPLPPVEEPLAMPDLAMLSPVGPLMASDQPSLMPGVALKGREPGMREALLQEFGGTATTESAVMAGLAWLARNQKRTGQWSLKGPYGDGSRAENEEAATAMALLAFQGRGFTHKSGPREKYARVVEQGWRWLLRSQRDDGMFFRKGPEHHRLYTQAQCAIALCELYGMTRDETFREPAQLAIDYLVSIQANQGGWRYAPGSGSDLSVTGWVVMALQSARMAGLDVPSETFSRVSEFLDLVQSKDGSEYAYMPRAMPKISMTAEGLLCRQYLGWQRDDERLKKGVLKLVENLPKWGKRRSVYYWYYATQVCHHVEGDAWLRWNEVMRQVLPENQVKRGRERGSWNPAGDRYGADAGRLYVTCLSIYTLEVYYRHLPIYRKGLLDIEF